MMRAQVIYAKFLNFDLKFCHVVPMSLLQLCLTLLAKGLKACLPVNTC